MLEVSSVMCLHSAWRIFFSCKRSEMEDNHEQENSAKRPKLDEYEKKLQELEQKLKQANEEKDKANEELKQLRNLNLQAFYNTMINIVNMTSQTSFQAAPFSFAPNDVMMIGMDSTPKFNCAEKDVVDLEKFIKSWLIHLHLDFYSSPLKSPLISLFLFIGQKFVRITRR